jgi:hypothetical protein
MPFGWINQLPNGARHLREKPTGEQRPKRTTKQTISGQEVNSIGLPASASNGGETECIAVH